MMSVLSFMSTTVSNTWLNCPPMNTNHMYTQISTEMDMCTFKAACTHARTGSGLVDGGSVMAAVKAKPRRKHQSQKLDRAFHLEGSGSLDLNLCIFICSCVFTFLFECLYFIEGKATTQASVTEARPGIPARWNPGKLSSCQCWNVLSN